MSTKLTITNIYPKRKPRHFQHPHSLHVANMYQFFVIFVNYTGFVVYFHRYFFRWKNPWLPFRFAAEAVSTWWGISSPSTPHHRSRPRPYAQPLGLPPAAAPSHPSARGSPAQGGAHWVEPKMYQKWPVLNTGLEDGSFMKLRGHDAAVTWLFLGGEGNSCDTHCVCKSFVWLICFFKIGYINFKCHDCGTMNQEIQAYLCGIVVFNWLGPFILRPPLLHKVPGLTLDALDWEAHWWALKMFHKENLTWSWSLLE